MGDACCGPSDPGEEGLDDVRRFRDIPTVRASAVAGVLVVAGLLAGARDAEGLAILLHLGALGVGGSTFVPETMRALRRRHLGVGTLMTVAAVGAVALGEYGEAASLAFLFSISEALESYALTRTRRGLRALLSLVPEAVTVRRLSGDEVVHPDQLVPGDVMVVAPGERLATDGVVRAGRSALDLSAITGESVPVEVGIGTSVFAGSINGGGVLDVEVTARTSDSSLARIVHIVEEAQERKGNSQRLAERVARPLVPGIMVVAAAIAVLGSLLGDPELWIGRSLVVLVAAAPCAFAIAVPVTVVAAIGASARMGVLVKGGVALEALAEVEVLALDKTGTLTRNRPEVIDVVPLGTTRSDVLAVAAALEARSDHPLAPAILAAAPQVPEATDVEAIVGNGLVGRLEGRPARLGKPGFIAAGTLTPTVESLQAAGSTVVLVERDGATLGAVAVRDELRDDAPEVVDRIRKLGIRRVAMLTGDNRRTAQALGAGAGVDEVHAELLPEDKVRIVEELATGGRVGFVGDGINDAPALATAHVGIAMGAIGSDVAIEAADVALMGDELTSLPGALAHARRAGRIMRQNLALSGLILAVLIPLAASGVLGLATVVATHELAEVFVIANGVRAGRAHSVAQRQPAPLQLAGS
jgi:cation-transporting P-type ATPase G